MKIRKIKITDFEEIYRLWQTVGLTIKDKAIEKHEMELMIKFNPSSCFVALEKEQIIATIFGTFNGRRAWIYHLTVHPMWQRKGYGSFLLTKTEEELKKKGAKEIYLGVRTGNKNTIGFYEKNGYSVSKEIINLQKEI